MSGRRWGGCLKGKGIGLLDYELLDVLGWEDFDVLGELLGKDSFSFACMETAQLIFTYVQLTG